MSDLPPPGSVPPGSVPPVSRPEGRPADDGAPIPPPPPAWASQPPIIAESGHGPGAGDPPPGGNRGLIITLAILGVLVLIGGIAAAVVVAVDAVRDDPVAVTEAPSSDPAVQRDDPSDVALEEVLELIDRSEVVMIQFQVDVGAAAEDADGIEAAGRRAAAQLARLRNQLQSVEVRGRYTEAVRSVRDSYLGHLAAWETYVAATGGDAAALLDESGQFWQDIRDTADVFVAAVEDDLPADIPPDLFDFANFILDRGFREGEGPNGTLV